MSTEAHESAEAAVAEKLFGVPENEGSEEEVTEPEVLEVDGLEEAEGTEDAFEADDQGEAPESADALVEITVGENLYEVPQEIADELSKAQDYTQKTQSVAAERKQAETLRQQAEIANRQNEFITSIQSEVSQAEMIKAQVEQWRQHKRENIDTLSVQDIVKIDANIEELNQAGQALSDSVNIKHQEYQQAREQALKELADKSTDALRSKFSNWNDTVKASVQAYGESIGFTEAELQNAVDPREWEVLYKASLYDKLQAGKKAAISKAHSAPIKPKSRRSPAQEAQTARLNQRKAIKNAKSEKDRHDLIQNDMAKRLGLT